MHIRMPSVISFSGGMDMSYRIFYRPVKRLRSPARYRNRRLALTGLFLLLFPLFADRYMPRCMELIQAFLIPGEDAVTAAAIDGLCRDLRSESSLIRILEDFLQKLLENR